MKQYKCRICKEPFTKQRQLQSICGDTKCIVETVHRAKAKREKLEKAQTREKLKALATKPELVKKAQIAFNAYIRARDYGKPCICCGEPIAWGTDTTGGVCDAGHYLSVGARVNLRFNEDNVHAQRKLCNRHKAGNAANYRIHLIDRIGLERVESLVRDYTERKYTREGLIEIEKQYKALAKELSNG